VWVPLISEERVLGVLVAVSTGERRAFTSEEITVMQALAGDAALAFERTQSAAALELVLSNPGVRSLIINFCGAFARTDVMAEGVVKAWQELKPAIPVFFSIHGTGEDEAIALVRARLGIEPYDLMEDAIQAAVWAAQ